MPEPSNSPQHEVNEESAIQLQDRIHGMLLGTAVGDSLGLPAEGLTPKRIRRWYGEDWRQRLLGSWGMVSDDTDHTVFLTQSLIQHPNQTERFARRLARSLRWWLVSLPPGIGFGTLRAIARLWLAFPPHRSGVYSAGNGPAMRIAPVGALFAHEPEKLERYVQAATTLTHTDPKAQTGALAIARTIAWIVREEPTTPPVQHEWLTMLRSCGFDDPDWQQSMDLLEDHLLRGSSVQDFVDAMGLSRGVTGYMYHTVPVVLYAWHRHFGDFATTLTQVLACGGDTDTTGAIVGALAGTTEGAQGIPSTWSKNLHDWPHNPAFLQQLSERFTDVCLSRSPRHPVRRFVGVVPLRNLFQLVVVLAHGFRRLLPPY